MSPLRSSASAPSGRLSLEECARRAAGAACATEFSTSARESRALAFTRMGYPVRSPSRSGASWPRHWSSGELRAAEGRPGVTPGPRSSVPRRTALPVLIPAPGHSGGGNWIPSSRDSERAAAGVAAYLRIDRCMCGADQSGSRTTVGRRRGSGTCLPRALRDPRRRWAGMPRCWLWREGSCSA